MKAHPETQDMKQSPWVCSSHGGEPGQLPTCCAELPLQGKTSRQKCKSPHAKLKKPGVGLCFSMEALLAFGAGAVFIVFHSLLHGSHLASPDKGL